MHITCRVLQCPVYMKWKQLVILILFLASPNNVFAETCSSNHSIGLGDGRFTERGLIATTFLDIYHTPNWARLYQSRAWSPAVLSDNSIEQYVQVMFLSGQFLVTSIAMQGSPLTDWWVTKFRISVSDDGQHFIKKTKEYEGNYDGSSVVMVTLQNSTPSIYFRVNPTEWNKHIALRLELYGCFDYNA